MNTEHAKSSRISPIRLVLLTVAGLTLVGVIVLLAAAAYVYRHPSRVKEILAARLPSLTGVAISVDELSYGITPLHIRARGLEARPTDGRNGFALRLGSLSVDACLGGPFGRRTLAVERMQIQDFAVLLRTDFELPAALFTPKPATWSDRLMRSLIRFFLVSEITWSSLEAANGRFTLIGDRIEITAEGLQVKAAADGTAEAHGSRLEGRVGPDTRLSASGYGIRIETTDLQPDNGAIAARIHISGGRVENPILDSEAIAAAIRGVYRSETGDIRLTSFSISGRVTALNSLPSKGAYSSHEVNLSGSGAFRLRERTLDLDRWSFKVEGLAEAAGEARLEARVPYGFELGIGAGRLDLRGLAAQSAALDRAWPLDLSGDIGLKGRIEGVLKESPGRWRGDLRLEMQDIPAAYRDKTASLRAVFSGSVQAKGQLAAPQLETVLNADDAELVLANTSLTNLAITLRASGRYPDQSVSLHTRGRGARLVLGNRRIDGINWDLQQGRVDLLRGEASFPRVRVSTATLTGLVGSLKRTEGRAQLSLRGRDSGLLRTAAEIGLLPPGWRFASGDAIALDLDWQPETGGQLECRTQLTGLTFSSPNESRLGERIGITAEARAQFGPGVGRVRAVLNLAAQGGELLWDRYYLDLTANPLDAAARLTLKPDADALTIENLEASLKNLIGLRVAGFLQMTGGGLQADLNVDMPATAVGPLYRHLIAEPFKYDRPQLGDVAIGGRIGASATLSGGLQSFKVKGRAFWRQGFFSRKDPALSLSGVELDLPVWYQQAEGAGTPSPLSGRLAVEKITLPGLGDMPLELNLVVGPNRLTIPEPPTLDVFSGRVDFGPVVLSGLFQADQRLETDLTVRAVELDSLLQKYWPEPIAARMEGRLETVRLESDRLASRGKLSVDIFGGRVDILNPAISGLASSVPALMFDCRIDDLDLEQMTAETSFGKIQGVLQGYLKNVEIVNGQPQRFELRLETVEREGVPQRINVRAVENIARLGGGESPFMGLAGWFAATFREFPYRKIGIAATLENDLFRVNGTIKEGGKEYLVKKGGFSGVDVVNLNPDNRISFKDMMKRINRISSSRGGPVVR